MSGRCGKDILLIVHGYNLELLNFNKGASMRTQEMNEIVLNAKPACSTLEGINDELLRACANGELEAAMILVIWGADLMHEEGIAFIEAVKNGHGDVVQMLLKAGMDSGMLARAITAGKQKYADLDIRSYLRIGCFARS